MTVVAFDVGGTHLRSALVGSDLAVTGRRDRPTPRQGVGALVDALVEEARAQQRAAPDVTAIGLAMAGTTDTRTGTVHLLPSLGLTDAVIGPPLERALRLPVRLVNDVNAAAQGEAAASRAHDLVAIFVGTGVGTGFVAGGLLLEGHRGMAAEGGHAIWRPGGRPCPAGHAGCFQASLGGDALGRLAAEAGIAGGMAGLVAAAERKETAALALLDEAEAALAALCVQLVTLLDPEVIVIGGGVAENVPRLLRAAERALVRHPMAPALGAVRVAPSRLGQDAGLVGAAILARRAALSPGAPAAGG